MSEWREDELGTILKPKGYIRGPFGSSLKRGEMVEHGVPVYEQKNAIYGSRDFRFFIADEKFEELKRFQVKTNDLIISCSGTVGKISIIEENDPKGVISQALLILRPDISKITLKFLFYFLTSKKGRSLITQVSHGSVQINIAARKIVETIPVPLPPLPEQKAIAEVLSSLDDKIDLLHRQNKTLEQMAETLFRQWFVEEAGEDWGETTLGELIEIGSGKGLKKDKFVTNGKYPILGANGEIGRTDQYLFNDRLIFTGRVGTLGNVFRIENQKVWLSDNTLIIKPNKYFNFIYFILKNAQLGRYNVGSTQPLIRQSDIKEIDVIVSNIEIHANFEKTSDLYFEKINKNQQQIHTLQSLRDTLLPKLMSGEVRIASNG